MDMIQIKTLKCSNDGMYKNKQAAEKALRKSEEKQHLSLSLENERKNKPYFKKMYHNC